MEQQFRISLDRAGRSSPIANRSPASWRAHSGACRIMHRPRLWKSYRGLHVVKELLVLVVGDRFALHANIHQGAAHDADANAFSNFDLEFVVINDLLNLADNAAASDDGIAATNLRQHFLTLLHLGPLWADDEEVHDHEDQDERQNAHEHVWPSSAAGCLSESRCYEH